MQEAYQDSKMGGFKPHPSLAGAAAPPQGGIIIFHDKSGLLWSPDLS